MENFRKSEKEAASIYGKPVPYSGAGAFAKGDVMGDGEFAGFLVENKYTANKSFSISKALWKKTIQQAHQMHKRPILRVDFGKEEVYVCLREEDFLRLVYDS